jgi:hypothetical protein
MPRANPKQPLIVICELCGERIPTFRAGAWYAAIDHGLDVHRAQLLSAPENARRYFRVTHRAGRPARLTRTRS